MKKIILIFLLLNIEISGAYAQTIYDQIINEYQNTYENQANIESAQVLEDNKYTITAGLNNIGVSFKHQFADFNITMDRTLAPDLFSEDRWLVTDTMNIYIDASKVVGNLSTLSESQKGMYAGVTFKRTFMWVHYANSYREGLTSDLHKLFFPFKQLSISELDALGPNEYFSKSDALTYGVGGLIKSPLYSSGGMAINGALGALYKYKDLSTLEVLGMGPDVWQLTKSNISSNTLKVSMAIELSFLNFLKINLLSMDYSDELSKEMKSFYQMNHHQLSLQESSDVNQLLAGKNETFDSLKKYIISSESSLTATHNFQYQTFLMGGTTSSTTKQTEIIKDQIDHRFFNHTYEKITYNEDFLNRIFNMVLSAIFKTDFSANNNRAILSKKVVIEYESEMNLIDESTDLMLDKEKKLTMTFIDRYFLGNLNGPGSDLYKLKFLAERNTNLDSKILTALNSGELSPPYDLTSTFEVADKGMVYLANLKINDVFDRAGAACYDYPKTDFFDFRNLFDHCRNSLLNDYLSFYNDMTHNRITDGALFICEVRSWRYLFWPSKKRQFLKNCIADAVSKPEPFVFDRLPMWTLKKLADNLSATSATKDTYVNFFGSDNVFMHGDLTANQFVNYFTQGKFNGLGVIDNFMRDEKLMNNRGPASVPNRP